MAGPLHYKRDTCRLCLSRRLEPVLSLAPTPPANAFVPRERLGETQACFPLDLSLCLDCGHLQLVDIVDPAYLFSQYPYASGAAPGMVRHLQAQATAVIRRLGLKPDERIVEIGSNDGTFLRVFREAGLAVLGVDPARNIAAQANAAGIETLADFFNVEVARRILGERGPARAVCANHVFAHMADMQGVIDGVRNLLAPDGAFVFEVGYLVDVYEKTTFDTMYHEHIDYHRVGPLRRFCAANGLELFAAERADIQGGAIRGFAGLPGAHPVDTTGLAALEAHEKQLGLDRPETFRSYASRIERRGLELTTFLAGLKAQGQKIAGYGAPAKATTLMYQFGLGRDVLDFIVDDAPLKAGLFTPGLHVPVVTAEALYDHRPDYTVVLAWNFAESIIARHGRYLDRGGRFIVPLPNLAVR
jgi:SAM-dependent methyltransferase